jgi:protein TonB
MKLSLFIGLSVVLHLLVLLAFTIRFPMSFINSAENYVEISNEKISMDVKSSKPFVMGDKSPVNKKPEINTNFQQLQKEEEEGDSESGSTSGMNSNSSDFSGYVPSYEVEELPVPLTPITPVYPEEARRTGIEGKVLVLLYIDEHGNVKKVEIEKSPSDILSKSAYEAVSAVKFKPARIGGTARAVCMLLTLKFHLN